MKQEFIEFLEALMKAAPDVAEKNMTESIKQYIKILKDNSDEKPLLTDNGKFILSKFQDEEVTSPITSKDLANQLGLSSRSVSGSMRKLVNDGFFEKMGQNPIVYSLTEKGKNYKIEEETTE